MINIIDKVIHFYVFPCIVIFIQQLFNLQIFEWNVFSLIPTAQKKHESKCKFILFCVMNLVNDFKCTWELTRSETISKQLIAHSSIIFGFCVKINLFKKSSNKPSAEWLSDSFERKSYKNDRKVFKITWLINSLKRVFKKIALSLKII